MIRLVPIGPGAKALVDDLQGAAVAHVEKPRRPKPATEPPRHTRRTEPPEGVVLITNENRCPPKRLINYVH